MIMEISRPGGWLNTAIREMVGYLPEKHLPNAERDIFMSGLT